MTYQTLKLTDEHPKKPIRATLEIKKSEFIAYAYLVTTREQAMDCVEQLHEKYPDARHHCWAYIIGNPNNTTSAGFDDDGEPSGTAGRPILNVLQHKLIGNVIIIVIRYFGGIKLGAGGLTRAYAGSAQAVVDEMTLVPYVPMIDIKIATTYANEAQIRYLVGIINGTIIDVEYESEVIVIASIEEQKKADFTESLGNNGHLIDDNQIKYNG